MPDGQQQLRWDAMLRGGDYVVSLGSIGGVSRDPYSLQLETASFFERPIDLEPNDRPFDATTWHKGEPFSGFIQGDSDADWYALDPVLSGGPLTIRATTMAKYLSLRLATGDAAAPETLQQLDLYTLGDSGVLNLPAGENLLLQVTGSAGPYTLDLGRSESKESVPAVR